MNGDPNNIREELNKIFRLLSMWMEQWQQSLNRSGSQPATKHDLDLIHRKLDQIMSTQSDLIAAATKLSTASDSVSVKLDTLTTAVDAVVAALQNADLSPEGEAALTALKTASTNAATAGDKVDAEVTKLDALLPTPAPAAPPTP